MDLNDRIARGRLIASMVAADDDVTASELEFLERALGRLGLSVEERKSALSLINAKAAEELIAGLDRIDRLDFLNELAEAAYADGHLDDHERDYIDRLAQVMALGEDDLEEALGRARALAS